MSTEVQQACRACHRLVPSDDLGLFNPGCCNDIEGCLESAKRPIHAPTCGFCSGLGQVAQLRLDGSADAPRPCGQCRGRRLA